MYATWLSFPRAPAAPQPILHLAADQIAAETLNSQSQHGSKFSERTKLIAFNWGPP